MKRPKVIRPTRLHLALPEDIRARLDLYLFSTVEQRVPFGAYQTFFVERVQEFLSRKPPVTTEAIKAWIAEANVPNTGEEFLVDFIKAWEAHRSRNFS